MHMLPITSSHIMSSSQSLPPVIFINSNRAPERQGEHAVNYADPQAQCLKVSPQARNGEIITNIVARHHGLASLSLLQAIHAILDGRKRGILWECGVFAAIYQDTVHPNPLGSLLLADMLVLYLALAQKEYRAMQEARQQQGQLHKQGVAVIKQGDQPSLHPKAVHPDSMIVPQVWSPDPA